LSFSQSERQELDIAKGFRSSQPTFPVIGLHVIIDPAQNVNATLQSRRRENDVSTFPQSNPYKKCVQYLAYSHVDGIFIQHVLIGFAVITEEKVGILA
jgi:hypothetical protein